MARNNKNGLKLKEKKSKKNDLDKNRRKNLNSYKETPIPKLNPRMDHIIRHFIKMTNHLQEIVFQMSAFMMEDPLVELMKNGLRPIQERVTSLRTQTSQYEKMERIPGGPKHFMSTSLKELDSIIDQQLLRLTAQSMSILAGVSQKSFIMVANSEKLLHQSLGVDDAQVATTMARENLMLATLATDENDEELLRKNITLGDTIDALNNLASLYEEFDSYLDKAGEMAKELGYSGFQEVVNTELPEDDYDLLLPLMNNMLIKRDEIVENKKKNEKHIRLFAVFNCQLRKNKTDLVERMLHYEEEVRRPFLQLHDMILKDAMNLKTRISNLQYQYAKRSIDL